MLPFDEFLNDPNEVHSFIWGIREGLINPKELRPAEMPTGIPNKIHDEVCEDITKEYHYYLGGFYFSKFVYAWVIVMALILGVNLL